MSDYMNTENNFDIHVAAEEIVEDNLGNSNESDFIELSDIAPQENASLTNLPPVDDLDILDLDQIPPLNVENVVSELKKELPSESEALNILIGSEDHHNPIHGEYTSQITSFNDTFGQNVIVEHLEVPSSSTPLFDSEVDIPKIKQKRKYTRHQKLQSDISLPDAPESLETPLIKRGRGKKPVEVSPIVDPPLKRSRRQTKKSLHNNDFVMEDPHVEDCEENSLISKRGRSKGKTSNTKFATSKLLEDTPPVKETSQRKGRGRQAKEPEQTEDSIKLDYSTLYEDESNDKVLDYTPMNDVKVSNQKTRKGKQKKIDKPELAIENTKEIIDTEFLDSPSVQEGLTESHSKDRNKRKQKKNITDNLPMSNLIADNQLSSEENLPLKSDSDSGAKKGKGKRKINKSQNLIQTEGINEESDKTLETPIISEHKEMASDEMDIEIEIKEPLIITDDSNVCIKGTDDNSDVDDISLSKLKEKSLIECNDDNLMQNTSNVNDPTDILLNNTDKENESLLEELTYSPLKRNSKQPVMVDFEYDIDKVILEKKDLVKDKENNVAKSVDILGDSRSLRKKTKNTHYEEDSDEDPFSKIELSESDSELTHRKGRKYYSDDEYLPWKKETCLSSDSAVETYDDLESKYRKKKLSKKKSDIEKCNKSFNEKIFDVNDLSQNKIKIDDTSESVFTIPDGASSGLQDILGAKTLGAGLQIKKVSAQNGGKLDIPILDPNKEKKSNELATQTNTISTHSSSSQTSTMSLLKLKKNVSLSGNQTKNACDFLKRIINTTSELGQLMCQKSDEFVEKKINSTYIKDTSRIDYCIQKSFLLFKLAKDNLTSMEENLQKEYETFLEQNNLKSSFNFEKKIAPQKSTHDSDCEIVEEPITVKKPKFNPKTVFLNKELSIKMAKKPVQIKQTKKSKNYQVPGPSHEVWINNDIMVKKVKPQQSFLAQDSRCKKPPDYISEDSVKAFFDNYYGNQSICAPFTSLYWLNFKKQNDIICNHFCVEKPPNYESSSDFEDSCSEDDGFFDINTSTENVFREINHNENSLNTCEKTNKNKKFTRTPKSLFTICIEYLNNKYVKKNNTSKITPKQVQYNKIKNPKSLIQLSLGAMYRKNKKISKPLSINYLRIQNPKSLFQLCINELNSGFKNYSIKETSTSLKRSYDLKSLIKLSLNVINSIGIDSILPCESIIHKKQFNVVPATLLELSLHNINLLCESIIHKKQFNVVPATLLELSLHNINIHKSNKEPDDFVNPILNDISFKKVMQSDHEESIEKNMFMTLNISLKHICYIRILKLLGLDSNNRKVFQLKKLETETILYNDINTSNAESQFEHQKNNISLSHICYLRILQLFGMQLMNKKKLQLKNNIDIKNEKLFNNIDISNTITQVPQQNINSLLSQCLDVLQSKVLISNNISCFKKYNNVSSLSSIAHKKLIQHMYKKGTIYTNAFKTLAFSIKNKSNAVQSLLNISIETIQRYMHNQIRANPSCMSVDDIFINNINSITQEEFIETEHDLVEDNRENFPDSDNDHYNDDSDGGWDAQIQLRELKSCLGPIIQNVRTQLSIENEDLRNVNPSFCEDIQNVDNNIITALAPELVKIEPSEDFFENDVPNIKQEPLENEIILNQTPNILLKTEMINQHLESDVTNRNLSNEDEAAIDLFEKFLRSNPVAQSVIAGSNTSTLTQNNLKVRRQYEPDSDEDSQCQIDMSLLVPHSSEPINTNSVKNNLMKNWTDDEESSSQINKKSQDSKNKRKKLKKKKNGTETTDTSKQEKNNIDKDQNNKQIEVLTKAMRYKLRRSGLEEKESTESEDDNLAVLKRDTKNVEVATKDSKRDTKGVEAVTKNSKRDVKDVEFASKDLKRDAMTVEVATKDPKRDTKTTEVPTKEPGLHKSRLLRSSAKESEIQCNNVDSTQKLDVKSKKGKNLKTKLSEPICLQSTVPGVSSDQPLTTEETNLLPNVQPTDTPINEDIKETKTPINPEEKKMVEVSIEMESEDKLNEYKNIEYSERDGWHCYNINQKDTKLYQVSYIPLHKLPEEFVEIYMKYNKICEYPPDKNDAEINRLTNLSNLHRQSSVKVKPQNIKDLKSNEKTKQTENVDLNSVTDQNDFSDMDNCDELEPSEDEQAVETECLPPVDESENTLARHSLIQDNDSDTDIPLSEIKLEQNQERRFISGPKSKRRCMTKSVVSSQSLVLTVDKMMKKELDLLHAPVVLDNEMVEEKVDTKSIFKNRLEKKRKRKPDLSQTKDDSSSEEEKRWVSTKTKLLKKMEKNIRESAGIDDVKRARLVNDFIRKHGGLGRGPRKRGYKISRKRLLEREKQLRVLSQELFGPFNNSLIPGKKGSGSFFKGRRNIRKVIDKKSLAKSTVLANMEEFERKKRLNYLQNKLRELLGYEENVQAVVINNELCLEYDFEESQPLVSVHPFFTKVMKAHQCEGVKFLWDACFESLEYASSGHLGGGCILAHCMGLGKTLQVLALLHTVLTHPRSGVRRVLVCCPLSTVLNWVDEIHKWLGPVTNQIQVFELSKLKKTYERAYQLEDWYNGGGIFIIGYELFRSLSTLDAILDDIRPTIVNKIRRALLDPGPDIVVCDEGHLLKNDSSVLAVAMSRVKTKRRIVLTGTPMQNNLREYYCMVNFVKPNLLGTYSEYSNRFENPIMNGQHRDSSDADIKLMKTRTHILHKVLEGCLQRQEASVLYPYLPSKHEYTVFITLTKCQSNLYKHYLQKFARKLKQNILKDFHILQKIWSHPQVLHNFLIKNKEENSAVKDEKCEDDLAREDLASERDVKPQMEEMWWLDHLDGGNMLDTLESSNKFRAVFNILHECVQVNDKVLLFSTSLFTLDALEYFLKRINLWNLGQEYYRLDGSVPAEVRQKWCREFNSDQNVKTKLFLISTRAGSLGLNMTAANRVILFDTSWNPAHDIQSIFRVYRFGQKKDCYIYRLVAMGTMEQKIYERSVSKQAVACRVVDEQQIERHYSMGELTELYRFDEACYRVASGVAPGVRDVVLLRVARDLPALHAVHEHDSLLRDADQHLPEHERNEAWDQFQREQSHKQMQCAPRIKRNVAKRCSIDDQQRPVYNTIEGQSEIKIEEPVANNSVFEPPQTKRKKGRPKLYCTDSVEPTDENTPAVEPAVRNNDDLVVKISDILMKHNFHNQVEGSTPVSNIALAVSQLINSSAILQNPDGQQLDLSERITKALKNYSLTPNSSADANYPQNDQDEDELITSDPIVKNDSMVVVPNSIKRKFEMMESSNDEIVLKKKKKKKKHKKDLQPPDDVNEEASGIRTRRKAALSAEKYIDKFKHLPEWTAVDEDDVDFDVDLIEDSGAVIDDIVDDLDEQVALAKPDKPEPSASRPRPGPKRKTHNKIEEEPIAPPPSEPVVTPKPKPKIGPKSKVKKPQEVPEDVAPIKLEPHTPTKKSNTPASDADVVILSDDDDVPAINIKKEFNIKVTPQSKLMPGTSVKETAIKKEIDATPIPLNPQILKNTNFIYIVAHIYQKRNPDLDDQSAKLAAEYSIKKELENISKTKKPLCEGPIYDIALQMLGRSTVEALWKTTTTSVDDSVSAVELSLASSANVTANITASLTPNVTTSVTPNTTIAEVQKPQAVGSQPINMDIKITENTPVTIAGIKKTMVKKPLLLQTRRTFPSQNVAPIKSVIKLPIKKPSEIKIKPMNEFLVKKTDKSVVPIQLIKASFDGSKREESILPDNDVRVPSPALPPLIVVPSAPAPLPLAMAPAAPLVTLSPVVPGRLVHIAQPAPPAPLADTICLDSDDEPEPAAPLTPYLVNQNENPDVFNSLMSQFSLSQNTPGKLYIIPTSSLNVASASAPTSIPELPALAPATNLNTKNTLPKYLQKVAEKSLQTNSKNVIPLPQTSAAPSAAQPIASQTFVLKSKIVDGKTTYTLCPSDDDPATSVPVPPLVATSPIAPAASSTRAAPATRVSPSTRASPATRAAPVTPATAGTPVTPIPSTSVTVTNDSCIDLDSDDDVLAPAAAPVDPLDVLKNVVHIQADDYKGGNKNKAPSSKPSPEVPKRSTEPSLSSPAPAKQSSAQKKLQKILPKSQKPEGKMLGTVDLTRETKVPHKTYTSSSKTATTSKGLSSKSPSSTISGSSSSILISASGKMYNKDIKSKPQPVSASKSTVVYMDNVRVTASSSKAPSKGPSVVADKKYKPKDTSTKPKLNVPMALKEFSLDDLEDIIELE